MSKAHKRQRRQRVSFSGQPAASIEVPAWPMNQPSDWSGWYTDVDKKTFEREIRDTIKTYKRAKRDQRTVPAHLCFRGIEDHKSSRTQRHRKSQMRLHTMTVLSVQMRTRIEAQHQQPPLPRNVGLPAFASDDQQQHNAAVEHDNTVDSQYHNGTGMEGSTAALCIDVDCETTQREEHFIRDDETLRHTSGWAIERALQHGKRDHEGALRYLMEDNCKDDDNSTDENCNNENNNNNDNKDNSAIIVNNNQISNNNISNNQISNNHINDYNINSSDIDKRVMGHDLSLDSSIPLSAIFEQAQVEPDPIYSMPSIPQQQLNTLTTDVNVASLHKPTTVVVTPPNGTMTAAHWQPQLSALPTANNNEATAANYVMLFGGRTVYPVCRGL